MGVFKEQSGNFKSAVCIAPAAYRKQPQQAMQSAAFEPTETAYTVFDLLKFGPQNSS